MTCVYPANRCRAGRLCEPFPRLPGNLNHPLLVLAADVLQSNNSMATQRPDMAPTTDGLEAPLSAEREDDSVEAQTGKCEDIDTCKDGEANDDVADINAQSKSRTRIGHEETAHRCVEMFDQGLNDLKNDVDRANLDASLGKQGLCAKVKMETDDQFIGNINSNHASQSSARMEKTPLRETFREITRHSESGGLVNGQEGGETSGLKIPTEPNKDLSSVDALFEERAQSHNDKAISSSLQRSGQANTSQERPTLTGVEELPLEVRGSVEATGDSSANLRTNSGLEKFITTAETLDQDRKKKLVRGPMLEDMYQELDNLPRNPRARVNMAFKTFRFRAIGAVERRKQDLMDSKWTPWADSPFVQHLKGDSLHSAVMHEFAELERCLREVRMTRKILWKSLIGAAWWWISRGQNDAPRDSLFRNLSNTYIREPQAFRRVQDR